MYEQSYLLYQIMNILDDNAQRESSIFTETLAKADGWGAPGYMHTVRPLGHVRTGFGYNSQLYLTNKGEILDGSKRQDGSGPLLLVEHKLKPSWMRSIVMGSAAPVLDELEEELMPQ